jgi:pimeloyl-ACP methyl ester carboxylesterase
LRRTIGTLHYALADRIERKLPHMRVPTLIVRGSEDRVVPQRWVEELAALLPNGRIAIIPDAPHAINYDAPAQLAQIILPFLAEQTPIHPAAQEPQP